MTDASPSGPPTRWSIPLPDLTGRRALVTGASDGVGVEIARALSGAGATVVMPVRNRTKGEAVLSRLRQGRPEARLELRDLDLASYASVRRLAASLVAEGEPIHLLVLNAGIVLLGDPVRHLSEDGDELHLQTNALAHASLVAGILPLLRAGSARIAVQCSLAARSGTVRWDDPRFDSGYSPMRAYAASKVVLGLAAVEFARRSRAGGWGLRTVLCHPGVALTNIAPAEMREDPRWPARAGRALMDRGVFGQSAADAALPALHAVTAPGLADAGFVVPGGAFELRGVPRTRALYRRIADPAAAARAWALVESRTGARLPDAMPGTAASTR